MAQSVKIIDVTKSYVPVDPKAFPENYHLDNKEDFPEKNKEVVFYEGHNFLPTSYGYKSYFGILGKLNAAPVPTKVDRMLIYQKADFSNVAIAMCEDGLYVLNGVVWEQQVVLPFAPVGTYLPWTFCIIGNELYCYRQGSDGYYKFSNEALLPTVHEIEGALPTVLNPVVPHPANVFFEVKPTFLNMPAQFGIFKAGSRLGFWDSLNSIGWSSIDDFADFEPSSTTLSGNTIFQEITGKIVQILSSADGFVIYATRSILYIGRDLSSNNQWNPSVLLKNSGIAFLKECTSSAVDTEQYAYTSTGLFAVQGNSGEFVITEVTDFLRETKQPVYLTILQGRYLFLEVLDGDYINSSISFTTVNIPGSAYNFDVASATEGQILDPSNDIHQRTGEQLRGFLNAAPIGAGNLYSPIQDFFLSKVQSAKPLAEGLPIISRLEIPFTDLPQRYEDSVLGSGVILDEFYTFGANRAEFTVTLQNLIATGGGNSPYFCNFQSTAVSDTILPEKFSNLNGKVNVDPGQDLSHTLTQVEIDALPIGGFRQLQEETWEQLDSEVQAIINIMSPFQADYILAEEFSLVSYPNAASGGNGPVPYATFGILDKFGAQASDTPVQAAIATYPPPTYHRGTPLLAYDRQDLPDKTYSSNGVTLDSGWTPLKAEVDGFGSITYTRERGFVTGINPRMGITIEAEELRSSSANGTQFGGNSPTDNNDNCQTYPTKLYTRKHNMQVRMITTALSTEDIPNPIQEGRATLLGYSYLDANGDSHTILFGDLPSVPSIVYEPVPPLYIPPLSFSFQVGNQALAYPTIPGALVFDTFLKKWGKMKQEYQVLVDFSPVNNAESAISYSTFGIEAGVCLTDLTIAIFDKNPVDSYIKLGKIGYYRQGMTRADEVRVHFRTSSTGSVIIETSIDGTVADNGLALITSFNNSIDSISYPNLTGRWHNIAIQGIYDIKHVEFRGHTVGNR